LHEARELNLNEQAKIVLFRATLNEENLPHSHYDLTGSKFTTVQLLQDHLLQQEGIRKESARRLSQSQKLLKNSDRFHSNRSKQNQNQNQNPTQPKVTAPMQNTDSPPPPPPGQPPQSEQQGQPKRQPKNHAWEGLTEEQMKGTGFRQNTNLTVFQAKFLWDAKTCFFCLRPKNVCFPNRNNGRCTHKASPTDPAVKQHMDSIHFPFNK